MILDNKRNKTRMPIEPNIIYTAFSGSRRVYEKARVGGVVIGRQKIILRRRYSAVSEGPQRAKENDKKNQIF